MKFIPDDKKMKFGMFMGPYHKPGLNPTVALTQDMQTIENLDRWGYDEIWIGEHAILKSKILKL